MTATSSNTTQKSALRRDWDASAYWRELHKGQNTRQQKGFIGFLKEELRATGYYGSAKKRDIYPV